MKLRVIVLGFGCVSVAMAEAPVATSPVAAAATSAVTTSAATTSAAMTPTSTTLPATLPPSTAVSALPLAAPVTAPEAPPSGGARAIPTVDEAAEVPLDCDKRLGAFQFATGRYEAKVKAGVHTWEDVANYHATRADWLQCVASGQLEAIKAERRARNELITRLNAVHAGNDQVDEAILNAQEHFARCDRAPLPADQALTACGPQSHIQDCAASTVKRLFAKENARSTGPREHVLRSLLSQHLQRRVALLQCVAERGGTPTEPLPEQLRVPSLAPTKAAANR